MKDAQIYRIMKCSKDLKNSEGWHRFIELWSVAQIYRIMKDAQIYRIMKCSKDLKNSEGLHNFKYRGTF